MPRHTRGSRSRNLDTYSSSDFSGRGYHREYQTHQSNHDFEGVESEHIPELCKNGRFWVVTSLALFSLIMGILLASLVHPARCPDSCHHATCIADIQMPNGDIRERKYQCTCENATGMEYCTNKSETMADKTLSAISTLFFVLFFVILILSCAFTRCLNRSEDRRVGIEDDVQMVHPAQAELSVHNEVNVYTVQDYMESGEATDFSSPTSPNNTQIDVMNTIPVATISRKPDVPTAVAILI